MILLNDPAKVDSLLLLLTRHLDRYGLRVNQKKVDIWETAELQQHRCRSIQALFAKKGDNQNPALVRKFVDAYLSIPTKDIEQTWNRGLPLLNRLLWSDLESLPNNLFERITVRFTSEEYLLLSDHKKLEKINHLNSKRSRPIDFSKRLQKLGEKSVHNSFHHEALIFAISIKDNTLKTFFEYRLASLQQQMTEDEIR